MQECRIIDLELEYDELEIAQRLIDLAQTEGPLTESLRDCHALFFANPFSQDEDFKNLTKPTFCNSWIGAIFGDPDGWNLGESSDLLNII